MQVATSERHEVLDITDDITVPDGAGVLTLFVRHTTCALLVNEFEPNLRQDFVHAYLNLLPDKQYNHDRIDDNARAHLLAGLIGPSVSVPYEDGKLLLGEWQRVLLFELDGPRKREISVS